MRIRGAILDELRRSDPSTRRIRVKRRELEAAITDVEQKLGRTATPFDMCDQLGLSAVDYQRWVDQANPVKVVSLDIAHDNGERAGSSLHDLLVDTDDVTGRDRLERAELVEQLTAYIAELPETPRKILAMYYTENMTFAAIARSFDLTEARISQIHRSTLQRLQRWIKTARDA
jgi:RNA polymerase sigma factor for flagellar operon FliA